MSANVSETDASQTVQAAPTIEPETLPGVPKKITNAQTVCNEKNAKGKLCNGHLKQLRTGGEEAEKHLRGDDVLFKCQTCGTLYMGPPLGHVRDPDKQSRFVEKELMAILQAAGGTLPSIVKNDKGVYVLAEVTAHHAPAAAKPAAPAVTTPKPAAPVKAAPAAPKATAEARPAPAAAPSAATAHASANVPAGYVPPPAPGPVPGETHEQKIERLRAIVAEAKRRKAAAEAGAPVVPDSAEATLRTAPAAASTSGTDSSAQADQHRPAAEAQAATGMASAVPLSEAAATASPVAGPETAADLAPDTVTEQSSTPVATVETAAGIDDLLPALNARPTEGETQEQKIARLKATVAAAKERARREGRAKE
jgi:hypothetical protein